MSAHSPSPADPSKKSLWVLLWPLIRPYRWLVLVALALNALHGVAISFQTLMTKYLIDDVILKQGLTTAARWKLLALFMAAYLAVSLVGRMLAWHMGYRIFTRIRERVLFGLRNKFFSHVNHLCLRFHRGHNSGELFNYLFGTPLAQIQQYFHQFAMIVPGAIFTLLWTIGWVALWDIPMTLTLSLSVILTVVVLNYSRATMRLLMTDYQKTESSVSGFVADLLRGSRDVKLYAIEERVEEDFKDRVLLISQKSIARDIKSHIQYMKQETVGYFCFALLCVMGVWRYFENQITIGEFQGYLTAFIALQGPLQQVFMIGTLKGSAQASLDRIDTVLTTASTTPDPIGQVKCVPQVGALEFRKVNFHYDAHTPVIKGLSITIPYGQHVALVGPSGSGKSTLFQLVLRLYDPQEGTILLDGIDLRHFLGAELRHGFGVVPQDPFIFASTIRENLLIVAPNQDDQALRLACENANAWEFISRMPQGLDTSVAEGGATLSGGQRQRLAIARALLADPSFFIFDEATSALDTLSEKLIQLSLENAMKDKTALMIAHRLATVKNCDRILVLDNGQIVQDGSYEELLNHKGLFKEMVMGQQLRM